ADAVGKGALVGGASRDHRRGIVRHCEGGRAGRFIVGRINDVQGHRGHAQAHERSGGGRLSDLQRGGPVTVGGRQAVGGEVRHRRLADAIGKGALVGGDRKSDVRGKGARRGGR